MELISTPKPHYIPGYTGYCPQYKYRIGDTFGTTTHKVLLDPTVHHAEKLVLSDRMAVDFQVSRPAKNEIDLVNARAGFGDIVYKHPIIPGYEETTFASIKETKVWKSTNDKDHWRN